MSTIKKAAQSISLEDRIIAVGKRFDAIEAGTKALVGLTARVAALERRWGAVEGAVAALTGITPSSNSGGAALSSSAVAVAGFPSSSSSSPSSASASASSSFPTPADCASLPNLQPCAEDTPEVAKVRTACIASGLSTAVFKWVSGDYYNKPLQYRRDLLGAPSIHYLCKSIVLENTHCTNTDCSDFSNSRFYIVLFQYTEKFNAEEVTRFIKDKNEGLGKKKFNFRLANPDVSAQLTGFGYNAVAPLGTTTRIPIILSRKITELSPRYFWMGGGHVDCKLRIHTDEFIRVLEPFVADFTTSLTDEELQAITE